jgi:hypothetical protein
MSATPPYGTMTNDTFLRHWTVGQSESGVRLNSNRKLARSTLHDLPSGATVRPPVQQVNQTKRYGKVH